MNKRIKELKRRAEEYASKYGIDHGIYGQDLIDVLDQKFAELIVNECRMTVSENFHECNTAVKLDTIIKDHFGL